MKFLHERAWTIILIGALATPVAATVHDWNPGTDSQASTDANWSPPGPIVDGDTVTFTSTAFGYDCYWDVSAPAYFQLGADYGAAVNFDDGAYPIYSLVSDGGHVDVERSSLIFRPGRGVVMNDGDFTVVDSTLTSVRPGVDFYGIQLRSYNLWFDNAVVKSVDASGIVFSTSTQFFNRFVNLEIGQVAPATTALSFGGTGFAYQRLLLDHVTFDDGNIAVNVSAPLLGAGYQIVMYHPRGVKAGPLYAVDPNGNVVWGDHLPADAITDLAAVPGGSEGSVALSWTSPDDYDGPDVADHYRIYASTIMITTSGSTVGPPFLLGQAPIRDAAGTPESITLAGLRPSQGYSFTVRVDDKDGDLSLASNAVSALAADATPPTFALSTAARAHAVYVGGVYKGVPAAPASLLTSSDPLDPTSVSSHTISLTALADSNNVPVNTVLGTTFSYQASGDIALPAGVALNAGWTYRLDITTGVYNLSGLQAVASSITFITSLTAGTSQTITSSGVVVDVPANAIPDGSSVFLQVAADVSPLFAVPGAIQAALAKLPPTYGSASRALSVVEVDVLDASGNEVRVPSQPLKLTVPFADADGNGIVDGSNPPIPVNNLAMWRLDTPANVWVRLPSSRVDRAANTVSAGLTHFSVYAVLNVASEDLSLLKVYPNPFRPSLGHTGVTFTNLPSRATIKIFTLSGRLVRRLDSTDASGSLVWDGRNAAGTLAAPDVYLYVVESGENKVTGKLAVGS